MSKFWWRIPMGVAGLSVLGAMVLGWYLGTHPSTGTLAGLSEAVDSLKYTLFASVANGLAICVAFGMTERFDTPEQHSPIGWMLGVGVGFVGAIVAGIVVMVTISVSMSGSHHLLGGP